MYLYLMTNVTDVDGIIVPTAVCVFISVSWIFPRLWNTKHHTSVHFKVQSVWLKPLTEFWWRGLRKCFEFSAGLNVHEISPKELMKGRRRFYFHITTLGFHMLHLSQSGWVCGPEGGLRSSRCILCEERCSQRTVDSLSSRPASVDSEDL